MMEDRKGKWSPEAGGAEAVKIYLALPCYINMRIREGCINKEGKKYGLLPYPRAGGSARVVKKPYSFFGKVFFLQ